MNKTIFITGSTSGIGKATAIRFAKEGWNVIAGMRDLRKGSFFGEYENVQAVRLDVTDPQQAEEAVNKGVERFGRIDVLFNCAGYGSVFIFEDQDDSYFRRQFETNFFGTLNTIRAVLPVMRKQKSGHIINTTSIAGKVGIPFQTAYVSSKHAVSGFTNTLDFELKKLGIRATVFEVGAVKTNFVEAMDNAESIEIADYRPVWNDAQKKLGPALENTYKNAPAPEKIAEKMMALVGMRRPPVFYRPTTDSKLMEALRRLLPNRRFRSLASFGLD